MTDLSGKVFVVTGATSGLGLATARALTARGAHVVVGARDPAKGRRVSDDVVPLDLADLDSVRAFAAEVGARHPRLDGLINNAGVMGPPRTLSAQGHELQFAVNHLAHFALTGLLLNELTGGRVVTVSSTLHRKGRIDFDDLDGARRYRPGAAYNQSKLANALFGIELHRRLTAAGSTTASLLAHPGYAVTGLQAGVRKGLYRTVLVHIGNPLIAVSAEQGARPTLYAATDPAARSGDFIGPGGFAEMRGAPAVIEPAPAATDPETARRLWDLSEARTGVRFPLPAPAIR